MSACRNMAVALFVIVSVAPSAGAGELLDRVKALQTKVNSIQSKVNAIQAKVDDVKSTAEGARDKAEEIVERVRTGVSTLSDKVRDLIGEAVNDIQVLVDKELEGRDNFIKAGGTGEPFRQDLVTLLDEFETLLGTMNEILPNAPEVSFADEKELLQDLPIGLLWPLYRVTTVVEADFPNGLIGRLRETNDALKVVVQVLEPEAGGTRRRGGGHQVSADSRAQRAGELSVLATTGAPASWIDYGWENAPMIAKNHPDLVAAAARNIRRDALVIKLVANELLVKGAMVGILKKKPCQIHGYVGLIVETDPVGSMGLRLASVSEALIYIADKADGALEQVMMFGALRELRDRP